MMALIFAGIGVPMFAGYYFIARDSRPDFSDYKPQAISATDGTLLLSWSSLRQDPWYSNQPSKPIPSSGSVISMVGYMMDGYEFTRDGSTTNMFILMPNSGHIMHPAHRIPDEMVEVWPQQGRIVFESRKLVWVTGQIVKRDVSMQGERALYALEKASVAPAGFDEVKRWFKP